MNIKLIYKPIETDKSFLYIYSYDNFELIDNCINEIKDKLNKSLKREVGFFSDEYDGVYKYGEHYVLTKSQKLTPSLKILLDEFNNHFETDFNGILINRYENGNNYIGKHSDSKNHPDICVMIISYGSNRTFRVFKKSNDKLVAELSLNPYEVLHMGGDFQLEFTHDIKPEPEIKTERYSISFHKYMEAGKYS